MKISIVTENYYQGGLDRFIVNLINNWPDKTAVFSISVNSNHPGLPLLQRNIKPATTYELYRGRNVSGEQKFGFPKQLLYRCTYYIILLPIYLMVHLISIYRSTPAATIVINGGHPGSLRCRACVIAHGIYNSINSRPISCIYNVHNSPVSYRQPIKSLEDIMDLLVEKSSKYIVTVSESTKKDFHKRSKLITSMKFLVIPNGIEDPTDLIENKVEPTRVRCIMLSTYEERKGHRHVLEAFKIVIGKFPNCMLLINGYGQIHQIENVKKIIASLGLEMNVKLGGFLDNPYQELSESKVLLVPSQKLESFGLTIIEAMALSVPVVATKIGGIPEVVGNSGAAILCESADVNAFADGIMKILGNEMYANKMGARGREYFKKNYSAVVMAEKYASLFNGATGSQIN
jgi:glycosyltransferase involved in cell wall biosynthesis